MHSGSSSPPIAITLLVRDPPTAQLWTIRSTLSPAQWLKITVVGYEKVTPLPCFNKTLEAAELLGEGGY